MPKTTLEGLLPQELRKDLTPAEEILLDKAQKGEPADFRSGDPKLNAIDQQELSRLIDRVERNVEAL